MTAFPAGREWCNLAGLTSAEQEFVHWFVARFRDYSPDAKRTVIESAEKFDLGVVEHGPLRLTSANPCRELGKEFVDATKYLAMIRLQIADIEAAMLRMNHPRPRPDDFSANDLRG